MADQATPAPARDGSKADPAPVARREDRWEPFDTLRTEVDRLFEDFFPLSWTRGRAQRQPAQQTGHLQQRTLAPAMEMIETDDGYRVTAELPGMDPSQVELKLTQGVLTLSGEKREETTDERQGYVLSERRYGSFRRSLRLPEDVDQEAITAEVSKGLLTLTLPRSKEARSKERQIEIKSA